MCPMRFILVFFSAILAGYIAWKTVRTTPEDSDDFLFTSSKAESTEQKDKLKVGFGQMVKDSFWVFVDMASGMYLWRNLKDMKKTPQNEQ